MTEILGIIPAGGKAIRFGGTLKEVLPVDDGQCGLLRCVDAMLSGGADRVVVSSTEEKLSTHRHILKDIPEVSLETHNYSGMWECLADIGSRPANKYLFAMPDTIFPLNVFKESISFNSSSTVGVFTTHQPERFGVFYRGRLVNKQRLQQLSSGYMAWGTWVISSLAMKSLVSVLYDTEDFTAAFNYILDNNITHDIFHMDYYYDFANFEHYKEFLCNHILKIMG